MNPATATGSIGLLIPALPRRLPPRHRGRARDAAEAADRARTTCATPRGCLQQALGQTLMLDPNNCVLLLNELDEHGYVERRRDPATAAATSSRSPPPGSRRWRRPRRKLEDARGGGARQPQPGRASAAARPPGQGDGRPGSGPADRTSRSTPTAAATPRGRRCATTAYACGASRAKKPNQLPEVSSRRSPDLRPRPLEAGPGREVGVAEELADDEAAARASAPGGSPAGPRRCRGSRPARR